MDRIKKKEKRDRQKSVRIELRHKIHQKGSLSLMNSITQDTVILIKDAIGMDNITDYLSLYGYLDDALNKINENI